MCIRDRVGVPGRIVRMGDKKITRTDMDQVHLPDPVLNDLRAVSYTHLDVYKRQQKVFNRPKKREIAIG